jgi:hypothetical protein
VKLQQKQIYLKNIWIFVWNICNTDTKLRSDSNYLDEKILYGVLPGIESTEKYSLKKAVMLTSKKRKVAHNIFIGPKPKDYNSSN